jgi:hypothetical protein
MADLAFVMAGLAFVMAGLAFVMAGLEPAIPSRIVRGERVSHGP